MKRQIIYLSLVVFFIVVIGNVSADGPLININITGNNITAHGYILYSGFGKYAAPVITDFSETISCTTINISNSSYLDCSNASYSKDISLLNQANNSVIVTTDENQQAYNLCLEDKAKFNAGLNSCTEAKNLAGDYYENYTRCAADLIVCNGNAALSEQKRIDAEKKFSDSSNQKWIYGVIGIALGIFGLLIQRRELFGPKIKHQEDNFNRQQAG